VVAAVVGVFLEPQREPAGQAVAAMEVVMAMERLVQQIQEVAAVLAVVMYPAHLVLAAQAAQALFFSNTQYLYLP
jgi:hypothetical protein